MADIALDLLESTDSKQHSELEVLHLQVVKALEPPPCLFLRVPVEIQSEIFALAIDRSNVRMLALTLVCRMTSAICTIQDSANGAAQIRLWVGFD